MAIALVLALAVAAWAQSRPPEPDGVGVRLARAAPPALRMSGTVTGLYPGAARRLPLRLVNRTRSRLRVRDIRVTVGRPGRRCSGRYLALGRIRPGVSLRPRGSVRVWLPVTLRRSAPDGCQRARFPLRVQARVSRR